MNTLDQWISVEPAQTLNQSDGLAWVGIADHNEAQRILRCFSYQWWAGLILPLIGWFLSDLDLGF
jgi:hypothetical protein